jgi:hypothetical protein
LQGNSQLAERWREASGADRVVTKLKDAAELAETMPEPVVRPAKRANHA